MKIYICSVLVVFVMVFSGVCSAAPEPAVIQAPGEWTLEATFEHPQQIMVRVPGEQGPKRFWYMIITVTNRTGSTVSYYPKCELMTDTFQIIRASKGLRAKVFEQIRLRHQGRYPFLESLEFVDNRILQGEDNARDIAIVWPDFDSKAKNIKLFIDGLSNETVLIEHPTAKDANDMPIKVYLRKTLELSYSIGGDPQLRGQSALKFKTKRWVMR